MGTLVVVCLLIVALLAVAWGSTRWGAARRDLRPYHTAYEQSPMGMMLLGCDLRIREANDAMCQLLGCRAEQLVGQSVSQWWHDDDAPAVTQLYEDVIAGQRRGFQTEKRYLPEGMRPRWGRMVARAVFDPQGRSTAILVIVEDVNQRRRHEESHQRRQRQMTAILQRTQVMLRQSLEIPDSEAAQAIRHDGQHLLSLIDGMLDVSAIEAGTAPIERVPCSTTGLIAEVASLMRAQAQAKGLSMEVQYDGPIPESIRTDPARLRQILVHLVGNAIQFTDAGKVRLVVGLDRTRGRSPALCVDVVDLGIGMTAEQIAAVEKTLEKGISPICAQPPEGRSEKLDLSPFSSVGLSISRRLAELLGGDLQVTSEPNLGSNFRLSLDPGPLENVPLRQYAGEETAETEPSRPIRPVSAPIGESAAWQGPLLSPSPTVSGPG